MSQQHNEPPLTPGQETPAPYQESTTIPESTTMPYAAADTPVFDDVDPLGRYADTDDQDSGSKAQTAKDEAANLAQTAKDSGGQVASTAKEQGQQVMSEATDHARVLLDETRTQLSDQAGTQQQRAAAGLRSLGDELGSMADSSQQSGLGAQLARQAANRAHDVAEWLDSRDPKALLQEARDYARRRPGTFLLGAALAGLVAGRVTRAGVDNSRSDDGQSLQVDSTLPVVPPPGQTAAVTSPYSTPTSEPFHDTAATGYLDPSRPVSSPSGDYGNVTLGTDDSLDSGGPLR